MALTIKWNAMKHIWIIGFVSCFFVCARQLIVPFDFLIRNKFSYDINRSKPWLVDLTVYGQKSRGTKSENSLASVFFGRSCFYPQQAHYNQQPYLQFPFSDETLSPRLSLKEKGFVAVVSYESEHSDEWSFGFEISIPWKEIIVKNKSDEGCSQLDACGSKNSDDLFLTDDSNGVFDFAINMDFALKLPSQAQGIGVQVPLINVENDVYGNQPTIGAVLVTELLFNEIDQNPVTVLKSLTKPEPPFFIDVGLGLSPASNTARGLPLLDSDGSIAGIPLEQGQRARFVSTVDYGELKSNKNLLRSLWLVPSATVLPIPVLTNRANIIGKRIKGLVHDLTKNAQQEFELSGLSFNDIKQKGVGDIGLKLYALYHCAPNKIVQLSSGFLFPFSGSLSEQKSKNLFAVSSGSNGHTQPFLQSDFVHSVCRWFSYGIGLILSYALPSSEYIPASFQGAIVKNCGPLTQANTSWLNALFQTEFYFFVPFESDYKPYLITSYQMYYKSNDRISFKYQNGYDWAGNFYSLSSAVAQKNSNTLAHVGLIKIGFDIHSYGKLECGWQGIVGGFNTPLTNGWVIHCNFIF